MRQQRQQQQQVSQQQSPGLVQEVAAVASTIVLHLLRLRQMLQCLARGLPALNLLRLDLGAVVGIRLLEEGAGDALLQNYVDPNQTNLVAPSSEHLT